MTFLILHGINGHAGIHWQQWLAEQLIEQGQTVIMPNLPQPEKPIRKEWLKTIQILTKEVDLANLIIVGHSLGVPSALDYIQTIERPIKGLISVSGFADDYGLELNSYFMKEKEISFEVVTKNVQQTYVVFGNNDPYVPQAILHNLAAKLGVTPVVIKEGGHLNTRSGFESFPLLLDLAKELIGL
jgi:predicted alpha/beta hydrolase family esterase